MDNGTLVHRNTVEPNYMDIMDIKLLAGRDFDPSGADSIGDDFRIIMNKTAVTKYGFTPETAVGQELYTDWHGQRRIYHVIGVMDDYNQVSPKEPIYPILLWLTDNPDELANIVIKTKGTDFQATVADIEAVWKKVNPDTPFEFTFLDQSVKQQYDEDRRISGVITSFSIIAMIISCLGLYGLSTYMAERRFKEIGVRKVLGASVSQIVQMMSGEFVKLVIIAFVFSVPLSWYAITAWLETFDYRTPLGVSVFAIAGVSALIIALLTVSFESVKAASGNPVNALRNE
jgi:putative ABC transport system permease protein